MPDVLLPYFDYLLEELAKGNASIEKSFGRHVHWGYWDEPAAAIADDEDYARAAERLTEKVCGWANIVDGQSVADIGCGFGGTIAFLNERHRRLTLKGVNIDARQLERAAQQVRPREGNGITFFQADACALPFADGSFDCVLAIECIFHFPSRHLFFEQAWRVLKPGGCLVITDFIPSPFFLAVASATGSKWIQNRSGFGRMDFSFTLGRYRKLAARTAFLGSFEEDMTSNTLPTYRYIQRLLSRHSRPTWLDRWIIGFLGLNKLLSKAGMINYYALAFTKPFQPAGSAQVA
jgi:SAM-dependent methyltransferase